MKKLIVITLFFIAGKAGTASAQYWEAANGPLTPANCGPLAISRTGNVFVGTRSGEFGTSGGVSRSSIGSDAWTQSGLGDRILLALTMDSADNLFAGTDSGVYSSTDDGATWIADTTGVHGIGIKTIVVSRNGELFAGAYSGGIFHSMDRGHSWTSIDSGLLHITVPVMALVINGNGTIFAGTFGDGIFRSTDGGAFWQQIYTGGTIFNGNEIDALAVNAKGEIFAGSQNGLIESSDTGNTWTPAGFQSQSVAYDTAIESIVFDPAGNIYVGSDVGVFRSENDGASWTPADSGLPYYSLSQIAIDSTGQLFASYDENGGVFHSSDRGDHWSADYSGLPVLEISSFCINDSGSLFADIYGVGIFQSNDEGSSWMPLGGPTTSAAITAGARSLMFAGVVSGSHFGIDRSSDNGNSWYRVDSEINNQVDFIVVSATGGMEFAGTEKGLIRSTDTGQSWLPPSNIGLSDSNVLSAVVGEDGNIFIGTSGGVFQSQNQGKSWSSASNGLTDLAIHAIVFDNLGTLYIGTGGHGVFRSTDSGISWQPANNGIETMGVSSLTTPFPGELFAAIGNSVYFSANDGASWNITGSGLSTDGNAAVISLAVTKNGRVFAPEETGGVFRSIVSLSIETTLATPLVQASCSPNPAGNNFVITFSASMEGRVIINLYDVLGHQVSSAGFEGVAEPGNLSVPMSLQGLASGTYFARIQTTYGEAQTVKLVKE